MKTSELIKKLEQFGEVSQDGSYLTVRNVQQEVVCIVGLKGMFKIVTDYMGFEHLSSLEQVALFNTLYKYAITSLDRREDEPNFRVRVWGGECGWLNVNHLSGGDLQISTKTNTGLHQTIFTKSQYSTLRNNHPEFKPFLPEYDLSNTDAFVPVEGGEGDD